MFTVVVQKLKFMTAVIFLLFSPTLKVITADILVLLGYRVKRSALLVFWYR